MAKKKSNLFKTKAEIKKTMQQSIMESVAAAASGVATSFVYTATKDNIPDNLKKFGGVGIIAIGTGLNVYAKDPVLKAASHGIATAGGVHTVNELGTDAIKQKIGLPLQGLENSNPENADTISDEELKRIEEEMTKGFEDENAEENPDEVPGLSEEE